MNHFKWKRFAIVYDFLETQGLYVKVWIHVIQMPIKKRLSQI